MKYDKVITVVGVVILLIAGVGIYFYKPPVRERFSPTGVSLALMGGELKDNPTAIEVTDSNPFYPLIVTPLAVHYDRDGNRYVAPLYVKNMSKPSRSILRAEEMIGRVIDLVINDDNVSPKEVSLDIVKNYWKKSDIAIILEDSKRGYEIGIVILPIASYLTAPVVVTNKIDSEVDSALRSIGVKYALICGNLSSNIFNCYHVKDVDDALNLTIDLVEEKFGEVNYITLANPIDAWPPRILDRKFYSSPVFHIDSLSTTHLFRAIKGFITDSAVATFNFTIPADYKYALIKVEVNNLDWRGVDEFGDRVTVSGGIVDPNEPKNYQKWELCAFGESSASYPPERDALGRVKGDKFYKEVLLYGRGGAKYELKVSGSWLARKSGRVQINVEVDKLDGPAYAMMKKLSSIAPYLAAYHRGILYARSDFAFYPNDSINTPKGKKCSGHYSVSFNPKLIYAHNLHVFERIHQRLNKLLAKLADIPVEDLRNLTRYYRENPIYIAIVGDTEVLPRLVYNNNLIPVDEEAHYFFFGVGTPSDYIYGNVDPIYGDWSNLANDSYSYYPYQENIVGRLVGWDVQDVCAQIVRTFFYYHILDRLGNWKDKAAVLVGGGIDFQRPPVRYWISKLTGNTEEAVKLPTGFGKICMERIKEVVLEPMGFDVSTAYDYEAQAVGFSGDALDKIKKSCLLNRLLFFKDYIERFLGNDIVKGERYIESSNFIFMYGHGHPHTIIMAGPSTLGLGIGGPLFRWFGERFLSCLGGGFFGPGYSLSEAGEYNVRRVEGMELGPSVMVLNSCLCGKLSGIYPYNSISMAFIHAGVNALIASTMETNIAGGYLEPKKHLYDTPLSVLRAYINTTLNAKKGIYPSPHFTCLLYECMCKELMKNETIGLALRNALNSYLPKDANWTLWWAPPLTRMSSSSTLYEQKLHGMPLFGEKKAKELPNKYFAFQEWCLYGDPAFNPYIPGESAEN